MINKVAKQGYKSFEDTPELQEDNFQNLESMVESLLSSMNQKKSDKKKKQTTPKNWKKSKKKKRSEEIGIIELPFTF
ncbi:MAG TPA: hypothetical protein PK079_10485 [Leptospiraceae bacterium]|nr:hypothetical protein [Leptospiraceae bacterium]HMW06150.1 hypothetical protein [Leptospiraceae bacterium]HMX30722.1 hypothetical protein [Leptospiraceae bacterium]HMY31811.1 hypothetical protein [Leptospiraceae bacterium]HMZ63142.1 hypothetical protein [Leptospiraceae bacterium]